MYNFGFIGAGKMGGAILKVLGCEFSGDIETVVRNSEYIVLGVKPQNAKNSSRKSDPHSKTGKTAPFLSACWQGPLLIKSRSISASAFP